MTEDTPLPSAVAQLFKAKRLALALSQEQLAVNVSRSLPPSERLSQQSYAAFERGKTQSTRHVMQIASALGLNWEEVAKVMQAGPGRMPGSLSVEAGSTNAAMPVPIEVWDDETPIDDDEIEVPLLKEVETDDSFGRAIVQAYGQPSVRFSKAMLKRQNVLPANVVCVPVHGNSMDPVLPDGSTAGIDRGRTAIKDGDLFALDHNGHLRIKLVYRLPSGGLRLRSYNRDEHPDEEYTPTQAIDQGITIIGRVFWYSVLR